MLSKVDRAITALQACAEALDALPEVLRRRTFWGTSIVDPDALRAEAEWMREISKAYEEGLDAAD